MRRKLSRIMLLVLTAGLLLAKPENVLAATENKIVLKTVDSVDQLEITGARYRLEQKEGDSYVTVLDEVTDGRLGVENLEDGDYRLVQTQVPNGYTAMSAPVELQITEASVKIGETAEAELTMTAEGEYLLTVSNAISQIAKLPSTGGIGTEAYTVSGLALMAAAVLYGKYLKNKEEIA